MRVATVASAVTSPTLDTVSTAPRCILVNLYFVRRRVQRKVLRVVCYSREPQPLNFGNRISQSHVAKLGVVAESLAVGGYVDQLLVVALIVEPGHQMIDESIATL